jgi:HEAT repeat protein
MYGLQRTPQRHGQTSRLGGNDVATTRSEGNEAEVRLDVQARLDLLFEEFRREDELAARTALERFRADGRPSGRLGVDATARFLSGRRGSDAVRTWATDLLEWLGGQASFEALRDWYQGCSEEQKAEYQYTRFFALRAMDRITRGPDATYARGASEFLELVRRVDQDGDEQPLAAAAALSILDDSEERVRERLHRFAQPGDPARSDVETWSTLRALTEFPHPDLADELIAIVTRSCYREHVRSAIRALGGCREPQKPPDRRVIQTLGTVVATYGRRDARLAAVESLGRLGSREAADSLLHALVDADAEVRRQAAVSLTLIYRGELGELARLVCDRVLTVDEACDDHLDYLADGLRLMGARDIASEYFAAQLDSDSDRVREVAERVLLQLGGRSAMRAFSRRQVLARLDESLAGSEQAVQSNFESMTLEAKRNYYFSLAVNALVVGIGLAVAVIGVLEIARNPEGVGPWLAVSSGGGLLTAVVSEFLIGTRLRGRDDVRALARFHFVYFGFLRKLSQIDATFRRTYLEAGDLKPAYLTATLKQLDQAVDTALAGLSDPDAVPSDDAAPMTPAVQGA